MGYICKRAMKVQTPDGSVVMRQPGDEIPEAENWPNPAVWVRRGFIAPTTVETANKVDYNRGNLIPAHESTEDDIKRATSKVPQPGKVLPEAKAEEPETDEMVEMLELSRADLDSLAEEHDIADPAKMPNKKAVAEAILAKQAE